MVGFPSPSNKVNMPHKFHWNHPRRQEGESGVRGCSKSVRDLFWRSVLLLRGIRSCRILRQGVCGGLEVKMPPANAGDKGSIPGLGRSPGEGNGNPLQSSCLEKFHGQRAWWAIVYGVTKSWTRFSDWETEQACLCDVSWSDVCFRAPPGTTEDSKLGGARMEGGQKLRRKWHPTPVFLPGESQGWGSLVGCHLWGRTESDTTEAT